MAKGHKPSAASAGPYLGGAFICERLLSERDNVNSVVRIVDTVTLPADAPRPELGTGVGLPLTLVIFFRRGEAKGERELRLRQIGPSGKRKNVGKVEFKLEGPAEGAINTIMPVVPISWDNEGLYWFEVLLGGTLVTRVPLRVKFAQAEAPPATPSS
jgi:hypothetical protein